MNYKISFQDLAEAQKVVLSRQRPVSLEQALKQVEKLKKASNQKVKKSRN